MSSTLFFPRMPWFVNSASMRWLSIWIIFASATYAAEKTAADYYVRSLPGQPETPLPKMHAGHVEVDREHNGNLFFWHFQNRHIANRQRTVVWLNGGPGCSSMDGALMEVGPYRLKDDHTLTYNEGSWNEFANLLFVDQPVGTGFSYVSTDSYLHELDEMADHFVTFLEKWFELFPEYEHDDLYFAGESYAGQYIPYIAKAILDRNQNKTTKMQNRVWNLKGLLIGNGWFSPVEQYQSYLPFAYKEKLLQSGSDAAKRVEKAHSDCISELDRTGGRDQIHVSTCEIILTAILDGTKKDEKCTNMYDIQLTDKYPACGMNWPPDLEHLTPYLRRDDVTAALHINNDKKTGWRECTGAVSSNFKPHKSKPSVQLLPGLLESGVPIVLFSGANDFICNHIGTEQLVHNMKWSGGTGFELSPGVWAPRHDWTFEGEAAGYYQEARNLTYILFYNASHMVPFDFARRSRDMLDRFMGVDITSIGGNPADSRIDGEKGVLTSVGNHPNSTVAEQREKEKLKAATWKAYYKSGEVVLVIVAIAAVAWGFFIWRSRRQRQGSGYRGIYPNLNGLSSSSLPRFRSKRSVNGDLEAAAEFDASELDNLRSRDDRSPGASGDHYTVGEDSEDEDGKHDEQKEPHRSNGMAPSASS
ncbi:Cell death protease [Emydomyces testavorans]|uniref:Pheromone-processing carboxypeptidase KEX1 n=1 Tax=Emydomyces testavorans TaxID=2070801 RepID=A0AAF0DBX3_9EURO|nr:Cell death protease [Emydomyces testavorans]